MSSGSTTSAIVTVGDELLLGQTVDTNASWLSRELAVLGAPVLRRETVADADDEIAQALRRAMDCADVVVVSGGLGPTRDDRTRVAVASTLAMPLEMHDGWRDHLKQRFTARGTPELLGVNLEQCKIPEGATLLHNPLGTAPGIWIPTDGGVVVLLPGVPRELKGLFREEVVPRLKDEFGDRLPQTFERRIHTTGIPESLLGAKLEERLEGSELGAELAFYPTLRGVVIVFRVRGHGEAEAFERLESLTDAIADVVAPYRFEAESGDLTEALVARLDGRGWTLAVAESCTGGLIAKRLTDLAGVSRLFLGGVVAYANAVKVAELGVAEETLAGQGAVSEAVAREMVEGVCRRLSSDTGIAVTGVAGPGGGTEEKPVGTVWYAARTPERIEVRRQVFSGDRAAIRERAAQAALDLLYRISAP